MTFSLLISVVVTEKRIVTVHSNFNIIWPYDSPVLAPAGYFFLVSISVWSVLGRSGWRLMDGSLSIMRAVQEADGSVRRLSNRGVCERVRACQTLSHSISCISIFHAISFLERPWFNQGQVLYKWSTKINQTGTGIYRKVMHTGPVTLYEKRILLPFICPPSAHHEEKSTLGLRWSCF